MPPFRGGADAPTHDGLRHSALSVALEPRPGPAGRREETEHGAGPLPVRLDRRPADLARRLARGVRARYRQREERGVRDADLDGLDPGRGARAPDGRPARPQPALVPG